MLTVDVCNCTEALSLTVIIVTRSYATHLLLAIISNSCLLQSIVIVTRSSASELLLGYVVEFIEMKEYDNKTIQIYIDGSKNEPGVGAGVAVFFGKELDTKLTYMLDNRCSNN